MKSGGREQQNERGCICDVTTAPALTRPSRLGGVPSRTNPHAEPKSGGQARPLRGPRAARRRPPQTEVRGGFRHLEQGFLCEEETVHFGMSLPSAAADRPQPADDTSVRARAHIARKTPAAVDVRLRTLRSVDLRRPPWEVTLNTISKPASRRRDERADPDPRATITKTLEAGVSTRSLRPGSNRPEAATRVSTDDAETHSARHRRECSADAPRASSGRNRFPTALRRRSVRAKAIARFADAPRQVIKSSPCCVDARTGPADVTASRIESPTHPRFVAATEPRHQLFWPPGPKRTSARSGGRRGRTRVLPSKTQCRKGPNVQLTNALSDVATARQHDLGG